MGFIRRAFGALIVAAGAIWVALGAVQQVLGIPDMPAQASALQQRLAAGMIWLMHANPNVAFLFAAALILLGLALMSGFQFQIAGAAPVMVMPTKPLKQEFVPSTFRFLKAIKQQQGLTSVQAELLMADVIGKWVKVKGRVTGVSRPFGDVTVDIRDQRGLFDGSVSGLSFTLRRSEWSHGRTLNIGDEVVLVGRIYTVSPWNSMIQDAYFADPKDEREAIPFPDED